jgi:hypothetical protein
MVIHQGIARKHEHYRHVAETSCAQGAATSALEAQRRELNQYQAIKVK